MNDRVPGSLTGGAEKQLNGTVHTGTAVTRASAHAIVAPAAAPDVGEIGKDVTAFRTNLAEINAMPNAPGREADRVAGRKRELVTPRVAGIYVSSAVRAIADMEQKLQGSADQLKADHPKLRGQIQRLGILLNALQDAQKAFFKPERFPDQALVTRPWNADIAQAVKAVPGARTAASVTLQAGVAATEAARWAGVAKMHQQFTRGGKFLSVEMQKTHDAMLTAYMNLAEELDAIDGGAFVFSTDGGFQLTTGNIAKLKDSAKVAAGGQKMKTAEDRVADVAAVTKNLTDWPYLVERAEKGEILFGGNVVSASTSGMTVDIPTKRATAQGITGRIKVDPQRIPAVVAQVMRLHDRYATAPELPLAVQTEFEKAVLGQ